MLHLVPEMQDATMSVTQPHSHLYVFFRGFQPTAFISPSSSICLAFHQKTLYKLALTIKLQLFNKKKTTKLQYYYVKNLKQLIYLKEIHR